MQKDYSRPGRYASAAPAWNRDDGHYALKQKDGVDHLVRVQPNIRIICEPLMGVSVWNGKRWRVKYLHPRERVKIYGRALAVLEKWKTRDDIFSLALYRRQVASTNFRGIFSLVLYRRQIASANLLDIDEAFFRVALDARPSLTGAEWRMLAERMPMFTPILSRCLRQARSLERIEPAQRMSGLSEAA